MRKNTSLEQRQGIFLKTSIFSSLALVLSLATPGATIPADSNASTSNSPTQNQPDAATKARVLQAYAKLPLSFEANQGQTNKQVKFLTRGNGYSVFLTPTEAVLTLRQTQKSSTATQPVVKPTGKTQTSVLRLQLVGSNPTPQVKGLKQLPGKSNYLTGKDSSKWHTDIAHYAKVQYQAVYPGIDLVYYGNQGQLEYDFVVAPGANPQNIRFQVAGASRLEIDKQGNLLLHTQKGVIRQHRPIVYQQINGQKKVIAGSYFLLGKEVGFKLATYNPTQQLVIDPVLSYSTYLGGSGIEDTSGIALDYQGNVYVRGETNSTDFPIKNALDSTLSRDDAFITKLNPSASGAASLIYSTYLGGSNEEDSSGLNTIAVDYQGNAYVTGLTFSTDFPTTENAFSRQLSSFGDAYVTKLNAAGNRLLYSTYLAGSTVNGLDGTSAIAVDLQGNIYVAGTTTSTDFPTTESAFDRTFGAPSDGFVTKINPAAFGKASLVYSTYLGGTTESSFGRVTNDDAFGIALDLRGNVYVIGLTNSTDFPIKNGFDTSLNGSEDAFVTKINTRASGAASLVYSTYLGGTDEDFGTAIAVDLQGNAYLTGQTRSTDFPTKNAFDNTFNGYYYDAFVAKVNPARSGNASLVYSTYLGGSGTDDAYGIAVDLQGNTYVVGDTQSSDFPTRNAFDTLGGTDFNYKAFVTKVNAFGNSLLYSTYLGGDETTRGFAIAVDLRGNAYVTGQTFSTNFPTKNAFDSTFNGIGDAFVTKISP